MQSFVPPAAPSLKENLKPVIAAILAGAMFQKVEVPQDEEMNHLMDLYQKFHRIL